MSHPEQHEERILRYALADPDETPPGRGELVGQLWACPECLAFGYRALADLPRLLAVAEVSPLAAARWGGRSAGRLEALLLEAAAGPPAAEREPGWVAVLLGHLGLPRPAPALVVAVALALLVLVGVPLLRQPPVGQAFARAQLQLVLEALPSGYGFLAAPPSPFWQGYALGLLGDVRAAGIRTEDAEILWSALLRSGAGSDERQTRARLEREACGGLEEAEEDRRECGHGAVAYRLRRALAEGAPAAGLLRSEEAAALLAWAGPAGEDLRRGAAPSEEIEAAWVALLEELLRRR